MTSRVEQLSPTRIGIGVELPTTGPQPDTGRTYQELAK